ncbi:hypothetical protein, partial [Filifactor alocis]
ITYSQSSQHKPYLAFTSWVPSVLPPSCGGSSIPENRLPRTPEPDKKGVGCSIGIRSIRGEK